VWSGKPDGPRLDLAQFVGELLKDHAELTWVDKDWQVDVTDAGGIILDLHIRQLKPLQRPALFVASNWAWRGASSWHAGSTLG
jgi:hypothetical protein